MARMLVIDADERQRPALAAGLLLEGYDAVFATSADDALGALAASPVDVALIDLMMPDVNGLELARQIRRSFPQVRVVLSSAFHLSARQVERTHCGAVGFVGKPYRLGELRRFLRPEAALVLPATC